MLFASFAVAAPYPKEGLPTEWRQPDGTVLSLRIHGDEFYGRTTTADGYTVLFNAADKTYYYAAKEAEGKTLVPTAVTASDAPPAGLEKQLKDAPSKVAEVREANIQKYVPDREQEWRTKMEQPAAAPVVGSKVGLTILVQFPDVAFPVSQTKMVRFCNEVGYTDDGNSGSIRDYFSDQSLGQLTHTQAVTAVVTMPQPRNFYNFSNYPTNTILRDSGEAGRLLVQQAISQLSGNGFDFSTLSTDGNNRVLATSLLFAGADSGVWSKGLWPHAWNLAFPLAAGGTNIYRYQCTNVQNNSPVIGTITHELGHLLLGYPDLYDTDASDGDSEGVGEHCLMGSANHLNGGRSPGPINLYLKEISGWANITDFTDSQQLTVSLPSTGNVGYRIRKPGSATEYFLIENRGAGDKWAAHCRDHGLAIWHIDEAVNSDNMRQQMTPTQHYLVSLEQADGSFDLENGSNRGDSGDLFDNTIIEFDDYTSPNALWWSGLGSNLYLKPLSAPGASMSVQFGRPAGTVVLGVNPGSVLISSTASSQSITVNSNATWAWTGKPSWITTSEAAEQEGNQTFTYSVAVNSSTSPRSATLTFTTGEISRSHTITQSGKIVDDHGNARTSASVVGANSTTAGNIEKAGDYDYFRIEVNGPGTLIVNTSGSTDTFGDLYSASGTFITNNDDTIGLNFQITRTFTTATVFYVRVRHYYSYQTGQYQLVSTFLPSATLAVTGATQDVPVGGGTYSVDVDSNNSWTWAVSNNAPVWVSAPGEAASQTGSQTFTYTIAANTGFARTAVISFKRGASITATHTIRQAGIPLPDLVDADERTKILPAVIVSGGKVKIEASVRNASAVPSGPFVVRFQISTNQTIHALDDPTLGTLSLPGMAAGETVPIDFEATLPGISSASYYFAWTIDSNNGVSEDDEGNNLVITAEPNSRLDPILAITPASRSVEGHALSESLDATCNSSWTWSSNVPWLTSLAATTQMNDQPLVYFVAANTNASPRTGTLTLTSGSMTKTHTVTQGPKPIPLEFTTFQRVGNNIAMGFKSELGKTYRVATSTSLLSGSWEPVPGQTGIPGTGAPISRSLIDMALPPAGGKRFFRVERE